MTTYKGSIPAYGIRQFPRSPGQNAVVVKPKQEEKYTLTQNFYDTAMLQPCWLLCNQTGSNLQFQVEIS